MKQRKQWDISEFNKTNLPEVVGQVQKAQFPAFSGLRYLDMPIFMPNQGWRVPEELSPLKHIISKVIGHEKTYGDFEKDHYVYITVDQKTVPAGATGRRAGAHSDAYIEIKNAQIDVTPAHSNCIKKQTGEVSHTYIIYDCLPTEFFKAPFPLTRTDCASSLQTFDDIAQKSPVVTYPAYTILKLDPYVVHRCSICPQKTKRTFIKVSISRKKYARAGNTINPLFAYSWQMTKRSPHERNHPWAA